ncbi:MAG TPA: hypothetical protein VMW08_00840 [Acidimicrobiales bacterium]|nr:hypothetical protein [Acidimicrobiales bacterium]
MGSPDGATKTAAARIGCSHEEYASHLELGEKWCGGCGWQPRSAFGSDRNRSDGLAALCRPCRRQRAKDRYERRDPPAPGRRYVTARDDDRLQARGRVNHLVNVGVLPNPDEVACCDCDHRGSDRRHEYDHFLGYAPEHHEAVEAVCTKCHHARERARQPRERRRDERGRFAPSPADGGEGNRGREHSN